jgi:hypothetical protein
MEGYTYAEAVACREGLAWASDLGLHSLRVASDFANTVRRVRVFGKYGLIVRKINARRRSFTRADFVFDRLYEFIDR